MNSALGYAAYRFGYEIMTFLKRWYGGGLIVIFHGAVTLIEKLDKVFAFKVTARNVTKPLYGDKTFLGYIMGFLLRTLRLLSATILYVGIGGITLIVCVTWYAIPLLIVYQIITNYEITGNLL